jgi:hypothetical protein
MRTIRRWSTAPRGDRRSATQNASIAAPHETPSIAPPRGTLSVAAPHETPSIAPPRGTLSVAAPRGDASRRPGTVPDLDVHHGLAQREPAAHGPCPMPRISHGATSRGTCPSHASGMAPPRVSRVAGHRAPTCATSHADHVPPPHRQRGALPRDHTTPPRVARAEGGAGGGGAWPAAGDDGVLAGRRRGGGVACLHRGAAGGAARPAVTGAETKRELAVGRWPKRFAGQAYGLLW